MDNQMSYIFVSQTGLTVHYLHLLFLVIQELVTNCFIIALIHRAEANGNVNVNLAPFPSRLFSAHIRPP
jgi:hypothetical protein